MKNIFTGLILILLLNSGCKKTETEPLNLKGTIKGKLTTVNEFGYPNNDSENIKIQLDGGESLISFITDSTGRVEINNIPSGTYTIMILKDGYGTYEFQGIQIVGGDKPLFFNYTLREKSSTTITDLSLEIVNDSEIYLKGIVHHNYVDIKSYHKPLIRYFIHNANNPSSNNYLVRNTLNFNGESGTQLSSRINIDKHYFPSGTKIYIIAYGCNTNDYFYFDSFTGRYIDLNLGQESNIASITLP